MEAGWTVHTGVFEGPLDLLLYLVKRDGIDLARFPVSAVTDAYLEYVDRMRELHLGVAGEYLVMAATLVWLKSLELLPRPPTALPEEDGEDPREALARRLRDLQAFRDAAESLDERVQVGREVFVRAPDAMPLAERPLVSPIDAYGLLEVYYDLLRRDPGDPTLDVGGTRGPDVAACAREVIAWLDRGGTDLRALLVSLPDRADRIATFVAVLEMARLGWIDLAQAGHLGPVIATRRVIALDFDLLGARIAESA